MKETLASRGEVRGENPSVADRQYELAIGSEVSKPIAWLGYLRAGSSSNPAAIKSSRNAFRLELGTAN